MTEEEFNKQFESYSEAAQREIREALRIADAKGEEALESDADIQEEAKLLEELALSSDEDGQELEDWLTNHSQGIEKAKDLMKSEPASDGADVVSNLRPAAVAASPSEGEGLPEVVSWISSVFRRPAYAWGGGLGLLFLLAFAALDFPALQFAPGSSDLRFELVPERTRGGSHATPVTMSLDAEAGTVAIVFSSDLSVSARLKSAQSVNPGETAYDLDCTITNTVFTGTIRLGGGGVVERGLLQIPDPIRTVTLTLRAANDSDASGIRFQYGD